MKYDNTDVHLHYDEARKISKDRMALWLRTISKYLSEKDLRTIIDLGCGTGRFLKALAVHFSAEVYGLDPSWKMLTAAQKIPCSAMTTLIQCAAEYTPLVDNFADLVFISQSYHHFENKDKAFSEIKRILKSTGFLCIRNSTRECLGTYLHLRFFPQALKSDHELLPSRDEVMSQLQDYGFEFKGHEIVNQKFAENVKEYLKKIKLRTDSDIAALPDSEFYEGLAKLEAYCKENDSDKPIFEDMDLFVFKKP